MPDFSNIISADLKNIFNDAIESVVGTGGLSMPCTFQYSSTSRSYCENCIFDPISNRSSGTYNGTGPAYFDSNGICPVCGGAGFITDPSSEVINLAVIFDSKYWMNWNSKTVQIPENSVQTLCKSDLLSKIKNTQHITISGSKYILSGDPELNGFGDTNFVICLWRKV